MTKSDIKREIKHRSQKGHSISQVDLRAECIFSDIGKDHVEACFYYEYARECRSVIDHVKQIPLLSRMGGPRQVVDHLRKKRRRLKPQELSVFKEEIIRVVYKTEFPKAWQLLEPQQRSYLADELPDAINAMDSRSAVSIAEVECNDLVNPGPLFGKLRTAVSGGAVIRIGAFAINLAAGASLIGHEFERWAARQIRAIQEAEQFALEHPMKVSPELSLGPKGDIEIFDDVAPTSEMPLLRGIEFRTPGPNSWFANLHRLGALRWRYYCISCGVTSFREAKQQQGNNLAKARPVYYLRPSDFNKACKEAVQIFREMFPADTPIHYSSGWSEKVSRS